MTNLGFRVLDPASSEALRIAAALVFAGAAIGKFRGPAAFHRILAGYRLLPSAATGPVARALPVIEASVALLLPVRVAAPWPSLGAAALLLLFAAAMAINLQRGRAGIECGCAFAAGRQPGLRWSAVGLDVGLAGGLLCTPADQPLSPQEAVTACLAGLAVFLLIQAGNALSALGPAAARPARTRL